LSSGPVTGFSDNALPPLERRRNDVEALRFSPIILSIPALFYNLAEWPTIARYGVRR
jgi:hypothetical protein